MGPQHQCIVGFDAQPPSCGGGPSAARAGPSAGSPRLSPSALKLSLSRASGGPTCASDGGAPRSWGAGAGAAAAPSRAPTRGPAGGDASDPSASTPCGGVRPLDIPLREDDPQQRAWAAARAHVQQLMLPAAARGAWPAPSRAMPCV
jgi:hypothetical protein